MSEFTVTSIKANINSPQVLSVKNVPQTANPCNEIIIEEKIREEEYGEMFRCFMDDVSSRLEDYITDRYPMLIDSYVEEVVLDVCDVLNGVLPKVIANAVKKTWDAHAPQ